MRCTPPRRRGHPRQRSRTAPRPGTVRAPPPPPQQPAAVTMSGGAAAPVFLGVDVGTGSARAG
jgi:hypothetical protein